MGRVVARELLAAGERVRVMTREPRRAEALRQAGAEIMQADLLDRESLGLACEGAVTVLAAAHSLFGRGTGASVHVDGRGHRDLIDAASRNGVRHFVYTSAVDFGPEFHAIPFVRIKYETEAYLAASGLPHTILRPTAFMEPHAHTLLGLPVAHGRRTVIFGDGTASRNFVAPEDVARVAVAVICDASNGGGIIDVAGPQNLTDREVIQIYERLSGKAAKVSRVPLAAIRLASVFFRPFHPGISQALQMTVALQTQGESSPGGLPRQFGFEAMPLETWARQQLARESSAGPLRTVDPGGAK
jgi:uncharacterized protein YbjT (DUF2867 family)